VYGVSEQEHRAQASHIRSSGEGICGCLRLVSNNVLIKVTLSRQRHCRGTLCHWCGYEPDVSENCKFIIPMFSSRGFWCHCTLSKAKTDLVSCSLCLKLGTPPSEEGRGFLALASPTVGHWGTAPWSMHIHTNLAIFSFPVTNCWWCHCLLWVVTGTNACWVIWLINSVLNKSASAVVNIMVPVMRNILF